MGTTYETWVNSVSTLGADLIWEDAHGNQQTGNPLLVVPDTAGVYRYTLYAKGCGYDSMNVEFYVNPLPDLAVEHPGFVCQGESAHLQVQTNGIVHTVYFGMGDSSDLQQFDHIFDEVAGIYTLQAIAVSEKGCVQHWTGDITVGARPEAIIAGPDTICLGAPVTLNNVGSGAQTCVWGIAGQGQMDGCNPVVYFENAGQQSVHLQVLSAQGCPDDTIAWVYVHKTPIAALMAVVPQPACAPAIVEFNASQTLYATGLKILFGDLGSGANGGPDFSHTYQAGQEYTARLIATSDGVCADTATATFRLYSKPPLVIDLTKPCTIAEGTTLSVASDFQVNVVGPNYVQSGNFHAGLPEGNYNVEIKSPEGCLSDTTIVVLKPRELDISLVKDSFLLQLGDSVQIVVSPNFQDVTFAWFPSDGLSDTLSSKPILHPLYVGEQVYEVVATANNGCTKTDSVWVQVLFDKNALIFLPTAFTPNGDGNNDVLMLRSGNAAVERIAFFRVYDKDGALVYASDGDCQPNDASATCGWDGNFRGQEAVMGVYRCQAGLLYINGETKSFTQNISLIR